MSKSRGKRYRIYFEDAFGSEKLISRKSYGEDELWSVIEKDIHSRRPGFKIYYTRHIELKDGFMIDYGSHSEFYICRVVSQ